MQIYTMNESVPLVLSKEMARRQIIDTYYRNLFPVNYREVNCGVVDPDSPEEGWSTRKISLGSEIPENSH